MLRMNRYKYLALEIVQRWQSGMEYLVDPHVNLDMLTRGCVLTIVGAPGTGKTMLSMRMAKWLHEKGCRAPALIDETTFNRFICTPSRKVEYYDHRPSPWLKLRNWASRSHTVVIVNSTLNRSLRVPRIARNAVDEDEVLAFAQQQAAHANHNMMCYSDSIWLMRRSKGQLLGGVLKSRVGNARNSDEVVIHGKPFTMEELAENPYFKRGVEAAISICEIHG